MFHQHQWHLHQLEEQLQHPLQSTLQPTWSLRNLHHQRLRRNPFGNFWQAKNQARNVFHEIHPCPGEGSSSLRKIKVKSKKWTRLTVCLNFEVSPCCCCQIAYLNNLMWMLVSKIDFICLIGRPQNRFLKYYVLCWIEVAAEAALLSLRKCNVV